VTWVARRGRGMWRSLFTMSLSMSAQSAIRRLSAFHMQHPLQLVVTSGYYGEVIDGNERSSLYAERRIVENVIANELRIVSSICLISHWGDFVSGYSRLCQSDRVWIELIMPKWVGRSSQKNTQSYGSVGQSRLNPLKKIGPIFAAYTDVFKIY